MFMLQMNSVVSMFEIGIHIQGTFFVDKNTIKVLKVLCTLRLKENHNSGNFSFISL